MRLRHHPVLVVIRDHVEQQALIETETAQQHVRRGHLEHLRRRKTDDQICQLFADSEPENRAGLVVAYHLLRQQHIGKIGFLDLFMHLIGVHCGPLA